MGSVENLLKDTEDLQKAGLENTKSDNEKVRRMHH
jgi:hypothetical protein